MGGTARERLGSPDGMGSRGREPAPPPDLVTGHIEQAGEREAFEEPFTSDDRGIIDDDIDAYLRDADLPPRPRGYVWMIRVPDGHPSPGAFLADVDAAIQRAANGTVIPKQLRPVFAQVFRDFYATGN
jgi:hypothetical protein